MIDRVILFLAGALIAIIAAPVQGESPFKVSPPSPFKVAAKASCPCGCGCKDCDPSQPCDCGCPCGLSYHRDATGCIYEYRGSKPTGTAWDAQGRKWVNGVLANPPRVVAAQACSS